MNALELLSGDAQNFVEKIWASRVHLHKADPADLVGLLSFDDVDQLLTSTAIRTPAVRLAQDGSVLPASKYTRSGATLAGQPLTGLVDARKVIDLFEGGATVVLQGLHRYWPPLARLIAELELSLGHPCQANAYLTPPGSQGFAVHSDSHDVFVFQTHGSKLWEVDAAPGDEDHDPREVLLEPGLSMYLPTGTLHAARAQNTVSLHVTIGINQLTWRSLVTREVGRLLAEVPDDHLPAGYLDDPARLSEGLADHLAAVADAVRRLDPAALADGQVEGFVSGRPPRLAGALLDRDALATGIDARTHLRRRRGHPCVLVDDGDAVRVLIGDRVLRVPSRVRPALEHVAAHAELRPHDLPLDDESALVLSRRLVREGLLEVVR